MTTTLPDWTYLAVAALLLVGLLRGLARLFRAARGHGAGRDHRPQAARDSPPIAELGADGLWQAGPDAVAAAMHAVWLRQLDVGDWDSDEPLWETVHAELARRYPQRWRREQIGEAIAARYEALLES